MKDQERRTDSGNEFDNLSSPQADYLSQPKPHVTKQIVQRKNIKLKVDAKPAKTVTISPSL